MIETILLIAFTVAVGGIISVWLTNSNILPSNPTAFEDNKIYCQMLMEEVGGDTYTAFPSVQDCQICRNTPKSYVIGNRNYTETSLCQMFRVV